MDKKLKCYAFYYKNKINFVGMAYGKNKKDAFETLQLINNVVISRDDNHNKIIIKSQKELIHEIW